MQSSLGSKTLSLLSPNDWRISNNESPPCDNESSTCNNESSPCVRSCTDSVRLREGETWGGTHTRSLVGPIVWKGSFRMVAKDTFWKFNEFLDLEFLFREGLWLNSIPIFNFFPSHFDVLQTARSRPHVYINQILQLVLFRKKKLPVSDRLYWFRFAGSLFISLSFSIWHIHKFNTFKIHFSLKPYKKSKELNFQKIFRLKSFNLPSAQSLG